MSWIDGGRRLALALIGLLAVARLLVAALTPLTPDEAYYALWARSLSFGYFDHPPLIAAFIRAGTLLFGETPLGIRFFCVLSALPASWFVWRAAQRLLARPDQAPLAALFFNATPIGFFGLIVASPDAPLIVACAAMLHAAARLTERDRAVDWIWLGVTTGLALEAKYSAALLAVGVGVAVLILPAWRRQLLTVKPWLALAAALALFAPNLLWNAAHGWATFLKQGVRVAQESPFAPHYLVEFVGAQLGLATPFVLVLAVLGLLPAAARGYRTTETRRLLLAMLLVPTAYFVFHALRARVEGNWPAFLYPALAISATVALGVDGGRVRRFVGRAALPVALAVCLVGTLYVTVGPVEAFGRRDPVLRMSRGWDTLAAAVGQLATQNGADYVLTYNYQLNAELTLLLPELVVRQANEPERYAMLGLTPLETGCGVGIVVGGSGMEAALAQAYGSAVPLGPVEQRYGTTVIGTFFAYRVSASPGAAAAAGSQNSAPPGRQKAVCSASTTETTSGRVIR